MLRADSIRLIRRKAEYVLISVKRGRFNRLMPHSVLVAVLLTVAQFSHFLHHSLAHTSFTDL